MLQQTTVATVGAYYRKFLALWPTVEALAAASREDVLKAWAGLGYYARARNLHACAKVVAHEQGGRFPDTEAALSAGSATAASRSSRALASSGRSSGAGRRAGFFRPSGACMILTAEIAG